MPSNAESELVAEVRETARRIAAERLAPHVAELDEAGEFSPYVLDVLRDAGWLGMPAYDEGGGAEMYVAVVHELSKVYPTAATVLTPHWFATKLLQRHSGPERWPALFAGIAEGTSLGALAATEPDAGSDLGSVRTTAAFDGEQWHLDGAKRFITNGGFADFYVVLARTGADAGPRGTSVFLVPGDAPGLRVGRHERKLGLRASATAEIFFDDVVVPSSALVGEEGCGFGQMMEGFVEGRVLVAAISLGIAEGARDHAVQYASERQQFGSLLARFQAIQMKIADMTIQVEAARALTYRAALDVSTGHPDRSLSASIAKTYASDAAMSVSVEAVQVLGGAGYTTDFPVEMLLRDAKIQQIYEGTNEIQRVLIARTVLDGKGRG